ncbi:hypothetical protein SKAU_G00314030 [Synaphobranchus kaupii]|uniref:Uncharacterized protein n=1 Tax=Synaphobranchus kaupii TaxID=118154 RepID=A0A9Q1ES79_SYNKA|nr:hypothetical protein SKAU_G00314030 [Synaphobranchus kaupii]
MLLGGKKLNENTNLSGTTFSGTSKRARSTRLNAQRDWRRSARLLWQNGGSVNALWTASERPSDRRPRGRDREASHSPGPWRPGGVEGGLAAVIVIKA